MSGAFAFDAFRLDAATRELRRDGVPVALPARAFACLVYLIERRERAVGRDELIEAMWDGRAASDVQLAQLILQCRRALGDDGQMQATIRTVPGFGYRWVMPLSDAVPAAAKIVEPAAVSESESASIAGHEFEAHAAEVLSTRPRRRFAFLALIALAVACALAVALLRPQREQGREIATRPVLVLPLRVQADDAGWLRLGGLDVVVERLRRNQVPVLSSEASVALLQNATIDVADAPRHAQTLRETAAAGVVVGLAAQRENARWRMSADLEEGSAAARHLEASADEPVAALRALADRVSAALGHPLADTVGGAADPAVELSLQQARAALLANEPERARAILLADPALARDEPLLRQQLADVDIRAGRYAQARTALDALLARPGVDARQRGQLLNSRGLVAVREGRFVDAGADFGAAVAALGGGADVQGLGRAYLGRGISRTSLQDYAGALADDAQARAAFERAGDLGSVARVDSNTGALEILRGHMAQADTYLQRALGRFRDLGFVQEEVNTLQLLFVAARARLQRDAAETAIDALEARSTRIVSPSSKWSTGLYRAEWLIWNGRLDAAAHLIDSLATTAQPAAAAEGERLHLLRATLARSAGRREEALAELAGIADQERDSADDDSVRADVTLLRARLRRELGLGAADTPEAPPAIATPTPRTPLRLLAQANGALARGDEAAAERAFASALALADEQGVAATIAAVVTDYAHHLLDRGRTTEAAAIAGRVSLWSEADFDCAVLELRLAEATRSGVPAAAARAARLAGERRVPTAWGPARD